MSNKFPKNFLWGAATAAHQVEGGMKNDWSEWELKNAERLAGESASKFKDKVLRWNEIKEEAQTAKNYISGRAVDHYNRYKEDIQIMKKLGFNTYRFSVEWSRIEPERGKFVKKEINHYRNVIKELRKNNIEPMITLWHRTNPLWIAEMGDWQNPKTVDHFTGFTDKMANEFKDVKYWITLNEPMMTVGGAYLLGIYPPQKKSMLLANKVFKNMMSAHRRSYHTIKQLIPQAQVGMAHAAIHVEPYKNKSLNRLLVGLIDHYANWRELDAVSNDVDFFGIHYYTFETINFKLGKSDYGIAEVVKSNLPESDMGWQYHPKGIYEFCSQVWKRYHKPIIITENGLADSHDRFRAKFIREHLKYLLKAIAEGVDIRGYLHWSLLDNLEWDKGFWPKFGLVEVNRKSMKRTIRPSAYMLANIIKHNKL